MDKIDALVGEHAKLRLLAARVESSLGPQSGVGWEDVAAGGLGRLCETQRVFADALALHEEREERVIDSLLRGRGVDRDELAPAIERAHETLDDLLALLKTVSAVCDGKHVHAVRTIAGRLREELEIHLAYEENVFFPLLEELCRPKTSCEKRSSPSARK